MDCSLRSWQSGGRRRLVALCERYGEAIEADLAFRGIDLVEVWASRRWRFLLNLIEHLPRNSFYVEAISNDDELISTLPQSKDQAPAVEKLSSYSPEKEVLAAIYDRLGTLLAVAITSGGGNAPNFEPFPRPTSAFQRVKQHSAHERHESLVKRLLPR